MLLQSLVPLEVNLALCQVVHGALILVLQVLDLIYVCLLLLERVLTLLFKSSLLGHELLFEAVLLVLELEH